MNTYSYDSVVFIVTVTAIYTVFQQSDDIFIFRKLDQK